MATAQELRALITGANTQYYKGDRTVSDDVYDGWKAALRELVPDDPLLAQVGAPVPEASALRKARHAIPMGSLANAFTASGIEQYVRRVVKYVEEAGLSFPSAFAVQPKMDGLSIDLRYEQGTLRQAITRGDGETGEDVSHNLFQAHGVPHNLPEPLDLSVRGEAILHRDDFERHFRQDSSNARASAAGTVRRLDGDRAQHLRFYAFDAASNGPLLATTQAKLLDRLTVLGFTVVPSVLVGGPDEDALTEALLNEWKLWKDKRLEMPYDCDGVVAKVSHLGKSAACGEADGCPRGQIAMKWRGSMVAEGEVVGILHSIGKSGAITPVAVLRPVECGGVTITKVSLSNWDEVKRLGVGLGAKVQVERAGEVIPKIVAVLRAPAEVFGRPTECPSCHEITVAQKHLQLCVNPVCEGQAFRKVIHYINKRVILHIGEEAVDRLMAFDGPVGAASDLYRLTEDQLAAACGGYVMAKKVLQSIEASKDCTLPDLAGSVGVPGFGQSEAAALCRGLELSTMEDLLAVKPASMLRVRGFGQLKAATVHAGLQDWATELRALAAQMRVTAPPGPTDSGAGPLAGKHLACTGPSELPRSLLFKVFTEAGATCHTSVVRGLDYLVMADANSNSTKARKAREQGVAMISEKDILDLIGYCG